MSAPYSLLVACPTYGKPSADFSMDSGWSLMYEIGRFHPEIAPVYTMRDVRTYRQAARNGIARAALELGVTHILSLDDDHTFDGSHFTKLWNAMQTNPIRPKILSALYMTRSLSCAPCIFNLTDEGTVPIYYYEDDVVMPVPVIGFGFVLLDVEIFRVLGPDLFHLGGDFGEDAAICTRLSQAGFPSYVHTGVKIGHILENPTVVDEAHYKLVRQEMERERNARAEAGEQLDTSRIVPLFPGAPRRTGYESVEQGAGGARRPWWLPRSKRVWYRDRQGPASLERRAGADLPGGKAPGHSPA